MGRVRKPAPEGTEHQTKPGGTLPESENWDGPAGPPQKDMDQGRGDPVQSGEKPNKPGKSGVDHRPTPGGKKHSDALAPALLSGGNF